MSIIVTTTTTQHQHHHHHHQQQQQQRQHKTKTKTKTYNSKCQKCRTAFSITFLLLLALRVAVDYRLISDEMFMITYLETPPQSVSMTYQVVAVIIMIPFQKIGPPNAYDIIPTTTTTTTATTRQ